MTINRWYIALVVLLVAGSGWIWASRASPTSAALNNAPEAAIGQLAPNFTLETLDGDIFELAATRGQPVVLNFWATWCGPCRRELPALQSTAERYADELLIVAVDQAEAPSTIQPYVEELALSFTIPLDRDNAVAGAYGVKGLPTTYFIDQDGIIRQIWSGEMNRITLAEAIVELVE